MIYRSRSHKFGAVRVKLDGFTFDSKLEATHYAALKLMEKAGLLFELKVHPAYPIAINGHPICKVVLDFEYVDKEGKLHCVDCKGHDLPMSRLKRKLVEAAYNFKVELVTK